MAPIATPSHYPAPAVPSIHAPDSPGKESFEGEIARFLVYERPLTNHELEQALKHLKKTYAIP